MKKNVKTPCIGVCSTVFGDEVCRGCKRYQYEVIEWNGYTDSQKISVLFRLETLKTQIMKSKIGIINKDLLKTILDSLEIKYIPDVDPYCWVFDLLRQASQSIKNIEDFGVSINDDVTSDLVGLKKLIESELFTLSEAHYQRYFNLEKNYRV